MSTRIYLTVPEHVGETLDQISKRAGYKSRRHFLRALTEYATAAVCHHDERPTSISEEVAAMFAALETVEAPEYGTVPTRHPRREM